MPVALNDDPCALAQTVAGFAERHGARESTRKDMASHRSGERPDHWTHLHRRRLRSVGSSCIAGSHRANRTRFDIG
jgi:hypothetical protein